MKRFPLRLWLPQSLLAVLCLVVVAFLVPRAVVAEGPNSITDLRITNVRDQAAVISWYTATTSTGRIIYGTDAGNLNLIAYDDRGEDAAQGNHYVTLTGLTPNTTYYFEAQSGSDVAAGDFTTGPTIGLPEPGTSYGRVLYEDGTTPAAGSIVYFTVRDADGSSPDTLGDSAPLSALVEPSGYWAYSFGNARTQDLQAYFIYSATGDQVLAEPIGPYGERPPAGEPTVSTWDTGNLAPAPDLLLARVTTSTSIAFFDATASEESITVSWSTVSEEETDGFNVWRSTEVTTPVDQLNSELIPAQNAGTPQGASYEWEDTEAEQGITYYYWLEVVDSDGSTSLVGPTSAVINEPLSVQLDTLVSNGTGSPWLVTLIFGGMALVLGLAGLRRRLS